MMIPLAELDPGTIYGLACPCCDEVNRFTGAAIRSAYEWAVASGSVEDLDVSNLAAWEPDPERVTAAPASAIVILNPPERTPA